MRIWHALGFTGRVTADPERHPLSGISNAAMYIAAGQAARGRRVSLFGFSDPFPPGVITRQGVEVVAMRRWRWASLGRLDLSLLLPTLWQTARRFRADVLHIHKEMGLVYLPGARARVLHLQGAGDLPPANYRHLLRRMDAVICCSEYVRDTFLSASEYPADRTFVVYNGALPNPINDAYQVRQRLGLAPGDVGVLFVGALVPGKGVHVLLDALRHLRTLRTDSTPRIRTFVAGGSGLWRPLPEVAAAAEAYERELLAVEPELDVTFLGLQPHDQVRCLYRACDVLVCPSVIPDAHPLVVCEAMAAGRPVVGSRVGGIPETILDEQTGILVPPDDAEALALALRRLVENPDLRLRMGRAAQERARLFTWEAAVEKVEQVYATLLEERRA